jgi:NhaP-type Na+/H+ or K+/H+ antiporter
MLLTGILLSPFAFNLLDEKILSISPELRQLALVIILTRAGLSLDLKELKKVGRPAILMCFVLACFEMSGIDSSYSDCRSTCVSNYWSIRLST